MLGGGDVIVGPLVEAGARFALSVGGAQSACVAFSVDGWLYVRVMRWGSCGP